MRRTTEYEVRLYMTRVRPSTRYSLVRGTIILEKYDKYKYKVRLKTELVRVRPRTRYEIFQQYEILVGLLRNNKASRSSFNMACYSETPPFSNNRIIDNVGDGRF